jgi:hypothetical protein
MIEDNRMKIKFNMPSINQLFGKDIHNKTDKNLSNISTDKTSSSSVIKDNLKEKEDIITYFYHNFYGQAKLVYDEEHNIPQSELEINLSIDVLYQAKVQKNEQFKTLEELAKEQREKVFGEDETAERLYNAAKDIAGDDPKSLNNIKKLIKKGFDEASRNIGQMPEISHNTLKKTFDKIDTYISQKTSNSVNITA